MIDCGQINTEKQNTSRYFCLFLIIAFHYTHCGFEAIFKWLQIFLLVEFIYHILCNIKTVYKGAHIFCIFLDMNRSKICHRFSSYLSHFFAKSVKNTDAFFKNLFYILIFFILVHGEIRLTALNETIGFKSLFPFIRQIFKAIDCGSNYGICKIPRK